LFRIVQSPATKFTRVSDSLLRIDELEHCTTARPIQQHDDAPEIQKSSEVLSAKLLSDERVAAMLRDNAHLRAMIRDICTAANPVMTLDKKMLTDEAALKPFYDLCLELVGSDSNNTSEP